MKNAYYWLVFILTVLPVSVLAQADTDTVFQDTVNGGANGAAGYGAGWWLWTVLLLAVVALVIWWAVRAGTAAGGGTPPTQGGGGAMKGGT
ncbi:MAG: hypothetical protein ACLFQB_04095 [Chitinispirillaceae bacterium]